MNDLTKKSGLICLLTILRLIQQRSSKFTTGVLRDSFNEISSLTQLCGIARKLGLGVILKEYSIEDFENMISPIIVKLNHSDNFEFYVVVLGTEAHRVKIISPGRGKMLLGKDEFNNLWRSKTAIHLTPTSILRINSSTFFRD